MNYFKTETACHCCGIDNPDIGLLQKLNFMRELYGKPIRATSICRCVKHNIEVGGRSKSSHITTETMQGKAADLYARNNSHKLELVRYAILAGFKTIVVYRSKASLIHLSVDKTKPQGLIVEN